MSGDEIVNYSIKICHSNRCNVHCRYDVKYLPKNKDNKESKKKE